MMLFGTGLAFFFGKPFIQPSAPRLDADPARRLDRQSRSSAQALQVNPLFLVGIALAVCHVVGASRNTRWGLIVRMAGDSAAAARAMGVSVDLGALPRHRGRRLPRRHRRRLPVALLSRQLERGPLVRARA